jgi:hypothetical protein
MLRQSLSVISWMNIFHLLFLQGQTSSRIRSFFCQGYLAPACRELGALGFYSTLHVRRRCPFRFWCDELTLGPVVRLGWGAFSAHSFCDDRFRLSSASRSIPLGRLAPVPTPPPDAFPFLPIMEASMNDRNRKIPLAAPQSKTANTADYLKSIGRSVEQTRRDAE